MARKVIALLVLVAVALNFLSVGYAKTPQEKDAEKQAKKEYKLQKKRDKELAKLYAKENIKTVEAWAQGGDVQAQLILSYAYSTGQHIHRDKKLAAQWHDTAAKENPALAENFIPIIYGKKKIDLARMYGLAACRSQVGEYVKQDFDSAVRWAQLGANELDSLSLAVLGSAYYTGRGVRQDYKQAIIYLKQADTEPLALYHLSEAYKDGNGVDKDLKQSKFYSDYLQMVTQAKLDKRRAKMEKKRQQEAQ